LLSNPTGSPYYEVTTLPDGSVQHTKYVGEINTITGPDTFRYKLSGKELDSETGLYYFRSRYYDPSIGRLHQDVCEGGRGFYRQYKMDQLLDGFTGHRVQRDRCLFTSIGLHPKW
jgi:RHS repeat-associated protein